MSSTVMRLAKGILALAVVAYLVLAPLQMKNFGIFVMTQWVVLSMAALGLNLTLGYAGQISLAQASFVGIGAYTVALLQPVGVPFFAAFALAGLLCFVVGWLLGYPALRVQHHYLAFVTLAFTTVVFLVLRNEEWLTGGVYGIANIARPTVLGWSAGKAINFYYFALCILAVVTAGVWWVLRSPWGRAFKALRENPIRALSLGIDTRRYTLLAFALGSAIGGLAGALYAPMVQFIEPVSFGLNLSLNILLMVIIGGSGAFFGPFVGALFAVLMPEWLRFTEGYYLMAYAVMVMVLIAFCPTGTLGLIDRIATFLRNRTASELRKSQASLMSGEEVAR
jgi:branched-chain amino acid transport system permease protein